MAKQAKGYHALIIHADGDNPTRQKAIDERISPGVSLAQQHLTDVCKHIIPIIPIRMTEAWLLADLKALQNVIGTDLQAKDLGIPEQPALVEKELDPKQTLSQAIKITGRQRRVKLASLYEPLAQQIDLKQLQKIPAYQQFVTDLKATLDKLHFLV